MDPHPNQHQLFCFLPRKNGDPYRIRTDVNGVRGRCLNHLTNGPYFFLSRGLHPQNRTKILWIEGLHCLHYCRSSPRAISTGQLHTLLHFHLRPIYQVVFLGPYSFRMRDLILEGVSRLDAFSVYLVRT